jgi:hypothetical protein
MARLAAKMTPSEALLTLEKLRRCVGRCGKIIEIAFDLEDDIEHRRKVSHAQDRSQLFAQDEAGSRHGAEEVHGPNAQRTSNKRPSPSN